MRQLIIGDNYDNDDNAVVKNKELLKNNNIFSINLLGSAGSGKTCVIEKIISNMKSYYNIAVIEGDLYTAKDAMRIENHNVDVIQINTKEKTYLDANMISHSLKHLDIQKLDFLIIENIGSLTLPKKYDLSEDIKIVVMSTTGGNDKPLKYPMIFKSADVVILNKMDIADFTDFNKNEFYRDLYAINKNIKVFELSCKNNTGVNDLCEYLKLKIGNKRAN